MHLSQITDEAERLEAEQAMVFLETHGSTSYAPEPWEGYKWAEKDYAPEWVLADYDDIEDHQCVTVLSVEVGGEVRVPEGYRILEQYSTDEKECPWCGDSYQCEDSPKREECKLCEGEGVLYCGEEWQVIVFKRIQWVAGAGQPVCNYDYGPELYDSQDEAIEGIVEVVCSDLSERYCAIVRKDLKEHGIHYFDRRIRPFVGHSYVEVSEGD